MTEQHRRPVASYKTYREAEHTVDHLSGQGFPVETVAITGQDVRVVEQVIGRMDYGRAAVERCALRCPDRPAVRPCELARPVVSAWFLALYGLIFGVIGGALFGMLLHALQGGRRDFASLRSMQPSRYEVVVDEAADEAVLLIGGLQATGGGSTRT